MPVIRLLLALLFGLLLGAPAGWAQQLASPVQAETKPAPRSRRTQRALTVHLPLPLLVARLGEVTGLLERAALRRGSTTAAVPDNPVLVFSLPLPKLFSSQATDRPAPSTP